MRLRTSLILAAAAFALAGPIHAQPQASPLSVKSFRHHAEGIEQVFEFEVANALDRELTATGRLIVLNVYDTAPPVSIPVETVTVAPGGVSDVRVTWPDAPFVGQVRVLLVLSDGTNPTLVASFGFWILPYATFALFVGLLALVMVGVLVALRMPGWLRKRIPANMIAYTVEEDDSVVTLSTKFDVTWQDLVKANRLKPPYDLRLGQRIFIPKHPLRRPEAASKG